MFKQTLNIENLKKYPISVSFPKGLDAVSIERPLNNAKSGLFLMTTIYKIVSKKYPKRIYIGSAVNFKRRKPTHINELKRRAHPNIILQNHVNKYGIEDLKFEILELVMFKEDLIIREQFYLDTLKPYFNICKKAGSCLGTRRTKQWKKKRSEKWKEKGIGFQNGNKMGIGNKASTGMKLSKERKEKMRIAMIGNKIMLGKKLSEETKRKMSDALRNRPPISDETRKKLSESKKGKNHPLWGKTGELSAVSKKVINIVTSEIFPSVTSAAISMGITQSYLTKMLTGADKNRTSFKFLQK